MSRTCQLGTLFRRCHAAPAGSCQYCGRAFCALHGQRLERGEEVCGRAVCQAKQTDLGAHLLYREAAVARSSRGFCAQEGCTASRWGQCSRCQALFCEQHLHERGQSAPRGLRTPIRPMSLCEHCLARRKLWSRT